VHGVTWRHWPWCLVQVHSLATAGHTTHDHRRLQLTTARQDRHVLSSDACHSWPCLAKAHRVVLRCLSQLAMSGQGSPCCPPMLVTAGHVWPRHVLSSDACHSWPCLAKAHRVVLRCLSQLAMSGQGTCCPSMLVTAGHVWPRLTTNSKTDDCCLALLTTAGQDRPLLPTTGHCWPWLAGARHCWPRRATVVYNACYSWSRQQRFASRHCTLHCELAKAGHRTCSPHLCTLVFWRAVECVDHATNFERPTELNTLHFEPHVHPFNQRVSGLSVWCVCACVSE
jgi:hypothetical protein